MARGTPGGWRPWLALPGRIWFSRRRKTEVVSKREPRSVVEGPIIYRETNGLVWHNGTLENVSTTGVLFRAEKTMMIDTPIEMSFTLPAGGGAKCASQIFCWGKVARSIAPTANDQRAALAARVLRYRSKAQTAPEIRYKTVGMERVEK